MAHKAGSSSIPQFQPSDFAITPFEGKDFNSWFTRILAVLADLGINTLSDEERDEAEWKSKDARAKSIIVFSIAESHLEFVMGRPSARAMMDSLYSRFGCSPVAAQMLAWKKLLALKYDPNSNFYRYLNKFESQLNLLESTGCHISNDYKICCLLSSMPQRYDEILQSIESFGATPTWDLLKCKLNGVMVGTHHSNKAKLINAVVCSYCAKGGHMSWACNKLRKRWPNEKLTKTNDKISPSDSQNDKDDPPRTLKQSQPREKNQNGNEAVLRPRKKFYWNKNKKNKPIIQKASKANENSNTEDVAPAQLQILESSLDKKKNDTGKMETEGKSRDEIKAQREAKKLAKLAKKKQLAIGDKDNTNEPQSKPEPKSKDEITSQSSKDESRSTYESNAPAKKSNAELKAERRAKQEAQRAEKEKLKKEGAKKGNETASSKLLGQNVQSSAVKTANVREKIPETTKPPVKSMVGKTAVVVSSQPKLLSHLQISSKIPSLHIYQNVHPAIVELGAQYADHVVSGSNARCVALLHALKKVIADFSTPREKEFSRAMEARLNDSMTYLNYCRQASVSMTNALKHVKSHLSQQSAEKISDEEARRKLLDAIDTFIKEQIDVAGEAICNAIAKKISNGDTIAIYGCSSLLLRILIESHNEGKDFEVVVVDGGPLYEGREMCRRLVAENIKCTYVLLPAFSYVVGQTTKVLLGAHALLANGCVMSRSGTALVAMIAKAHNVAVIVCCETYKFCERAQADAFVHNELGPHDEGKGPPSISLMYDITPPSLVDAVATELAILPCTSVPVVLRLKPSDVSQYYY